MTAKENPTRGEILLARFENEISNVTANVLTNSLSQKDEDEKRKAKKELLLYITNLEFFFQEQKGNSIL